MGLPVHIIRAGQEIDFQRGGSVNVIYLLVDQRIVRANVADEDIQAIVAAGARYLQTAAEPMELPPLASAQSQEPEYAGPVVFGGGTKEEEDELPQAQPVRPPPQRKISVDSAGNPIVLRQGGVRLEDYVEETDVGEPPQA